MLGMREGAFIRNVDFRVPISSSYPRKARAVDPQGTAQCAVGRGDPLPWETKGLWHEDIGKAEMDDS